MVNTGTLLLLYLRSKELSPSALGVDLPIQSAASPDDDEIEEVPEDYGY